MNALGQRDRLHDFARLRLDKRHKSEHRAIGERGEKPCHEEQAKQCGHRAVPKRRG
jgi:hypothetical protein